MSAEISTGQEEVSSSPDLIEGKEVGSNSVQTNVSTPDLKNPSSPYTALSGSIKQGVGSDEEKMRFFGPRFMVIWVMPIAVTGILMEYLFVGPLRNASPFN